MSMYTGRGTSSNRSASGRLSLAAQLWRRHGWLIIGLLWIVALILGCIGFALNAPSAGKSGRFFDVAYRTLQLIPMNSGDVDGAAWPLDAARFLIPFLAAWTAIRGLLALFRDRWQQFLLRFWRDHVIICGLGRAKQDQKDRPIGITIRGGESR